MGVILSSDRTKTQCISWPALLSSCETVEIEQFIFYDIDTIMSLYGSKSASEGVDITTGGYNIKHPPGCT